jgi:hypothetical protein
LERGQETIVVFVENIALFVLQTLILLVTSVLQLLSDSIESDRRRLF